MNAENPEYKFLSFTVTSGSAYADEPVSRWDTWDWRFAFRIPLVQTAEQPIDYINPLTWIYPHGQVYPY